MGKARPQPRRPPVAVDALVEEGAFCDGGDATTATAALLRAIRGLIGPPKAPDPLFLSPLCLQIREAIGRAICVEQGGADGAGSEAAFVKLMSENDGAIRTLEAQLPAMPHSPAELLARAEIASYFADRSQDGKTLETLASDDCFEATSSRLIEACMAYFGAPASTEEVKAGVERCRCDCASPHATFSRGLGGQQFISTA